MEINITLDSWNIEQAKRKIVKMCFAQNSNRKNCDIAKMLGMSERNLYRIIPELGLTKEERAIVRAKDTLEKNGYIVIKTKK